MRTTISCRAHCQHFAVTVESPQQYAKLVISYASQKFGDSLYEGQHFSTLANYLERIFLPAPNPPVSNENARSAQHQPSFVTLHDFNRERVHTELFDEPQQLVGFCEGIEQASTPPALLLFMNEYPSPEWLATIGWLFVIDPEFFLRHFDYKSPSTKRDYLSQPSLPSSASSIIQLRLTTIGSRHR